MTVPRQALCGCSHTEGEHNPAVKAKPCSVCTCTSFILTGYRWLEVTIREERL